MALAYIVTCARERANIVANRNFSHSISSYQQRHCLSTLPDERIIHEGLHDMSRSKPLFHEMLQTKKYEVLLIKRNSLLIGMYVFWSYRSPIRPGNKGAWIPRGLRVRAKIQRCRRCSQHVEMILPTNVASYATLSDKDPKTVSVSNA